MFQTMEAHLGMDDFSLTGRGMLLHTQGLPKKWICDGISKYGGKGKAWTSFILFAFWYW